MTKIKICGINTLDALNAASGSGANYLGFVFVQSSPRFVDIENARHLAGHIPTSIKSVGLFKDADDDFIKLVTDRVPLNMIQLHGREDPSRVEHIRRKFGMPVIKAIPVADETDIKAINVYSSVVDWFLFDTKLADGQSGGSGHTFDWGLLADLKIKKPWMLAGGLDAENVGEALSLLKPDAVDVSSGVEKSIAVKDKSKIKRFIESVKSA
ncbi:MAG: phosphoribosylanthranilate isomerase [Alphaproteobacteria bacterium]|nr:phosphoribosylanthranilate isomerase [Alphaproteobacteria bacterium]|tara:strand:- start:173 stop:805 length:633 start_codon:yes stop_codon:yes gene_type:complete